MILKQKNKLGVKMKTLHLVVVLFMVNIANATSDCIEPSGIYTSKEMILNQFVFENGTQNWGDWCYEVNSSEESKICNKELDQWDNWLSCSDSSFKNSCEKWAKKENFAANEKELGEFVQECIKTKYKNLAYRISNKAKCDVKSVFTELTSGINKEVICREVSRVLTGSSVFTDGSQLYIKINSRQTYELELSQINLKVEDSYSYIGSGILKWNPDGEKVILN
jgi:hypothetical protein